MISEPRNDGVILSDGEGRLAISLQAQKEPRVARDLAADGAQLQPSCPDVCQGADQQMVPQLVFHDENKASGFRPTLSMGDLSLAMTSKTSDKTHAMEKQPSLQDRVIARLNVLPFNAFKAAERGGFERTYVSEIVRGKKATIRGSNLKRLAAALETSVAYLTGDTDDPAPLPEITPTDRQLVPVRTSGIVEAGAFREVDDFDQSEPRTIFVSRDETFPNARHLAWDVAGDSMNDLKPRPILPGDTVVAVAYEDIAHRVPLRDGMTVVVERTRDGGHMREWSIKQLELYEDRVEFHPRSTNPRHKPIVIERNAHADEGTTVEIIAVVRKILNEVPLS